MTTIAAFSRLRRRGARAHSAVASGWTGGRFGLAIGASLLLAAAPPKPRPQVMLMTGLPLVWGETGPFDPGSRPAAAYLELREDFDFRPADVLDRETLARGRYLFLVQPQRLAPSELVALDGWIRKGGRALVLTDPVLAWPSELPHGDIRRPPPAGLLAPLLGHWGLTMEPAGRAGKAAWRWRGRRVMVDSPGRLRSSSPGCVVGEEDWTALCRVGRGTVRIVADADLMRDSLWSSADNPVAVREWLDETVGAPRPAEKPWTGGGVALSLLAILVATGLLLSHRAKR